MYFDFGNNKPNDNGKNLGEQGYDPTFGHGKFTLGDQGTWGYDDARWFTVAIDPSCRADWMRIQFGRVRQFIESNSFLQAPGRLFGDGAVAAPYRLSQEPVTFND
ncbi:MAG: hypothetical protein WKG07_22505 [Hymenobacter sp.]